MKNAFGYEFDFEAAAQLMDNEICEEINAELAPCTEEEFFEAYCKAHEEKYGEEFELAKETPNW